MFHVIGDTGLVAGNMCADYTNIDPHAVPSFCYHVGDVVYSFGEPQYYYDQFYDPFRNYPAPIFAIPGNHDGMVAPALTDKQLDFLNAALKRAKTDDAPGVVLSAEMLKEIDAACEAVQFWPHAILSGHAHNYQRGRAYGTNPARAAVVERWHRHHHARELRRSGFRLPARHAGRLRHGGSRHAQTRALPSEIVTLVTNDL